MILLLLCRPQDPFPTFTETEYIMENIVPKQSQLKYAIVDNDEISFHSLHLLNSLSPVSIGTCSSSTN